MAKYVKQVIEVDAVQFQFEVVGIDINGVHSIHPNGSWLITESPVNGNRQYIMSDKEFRSTYELVGLKLTTEKIGDEIRRLCNPSMPMQMNPVILPYEHSINKFLLNGPTCNSEQSILNKKGE